MMSGLSTKQLQPADVDPLELSDDRERQKSSRSVAPVNTSTQVYETGFRDSTSSFSSAATAQNGTDEVPSSRLMGC